MSHTENVKFKLTYELFVDGVLHEDFEEYEPALDALEALGERGKRAYIDEIRTKTIKEVSRSCMRCVVGHNF